MKVFFIGDFKTCSGPGMASKALQKALSNNINIDFSNANNKLSRIVEIVKKIIKTDCVVLCSSSKANIIAIILCNVLRKPSYYIMHGYLTMERRTNSNKTVNIRKLQKVQKYEKFIFSNVDKVFCVSEQLMEYMKLAEPCFSDKFDYNYNAIDISDIKRIAELSCGSKNGGTVISVGGGMKIKNNLKVCMAIDKLNRDQSTNLKYIVIGAPGTEKDMICEYDFVTYYDKLPHERVIELFAQSDLYIQNSSFDTFGLSVIEALIAGCNILISKSVGASGVLHTITDDDIIFDPNNIDEIAGKIEKVLLSSNVERLINGLSVNDIDYVNAAKKLLSKIERMENVIEKK